MGLCRQLLGSRAAAYLAKADCHRSRHHIIDRQGAKGQRNCVGAVEACRGTMFSIFGTAAHLWSDDDCSKPQSGTLKGCRAVPADMAPVSIA